MIEDKLNGRPSMQGTEDCSAARIPRLSAEEYLRQSILDPGALVPEGFGDRIPKGIPLFFLDEEVDDLVAFMIAQ